MKSRKRFDGAKKMGLNLEFRQTGDKRATCEKAEVAELEDMSGMNGLEEMNECIARNAGNNAPVRVFDAFWRSGELALMFGAAGTGKSILAVQLAGALARGRDIPGYDLEADPAPVLYVDLVMSGKQFSQRYGAGACRFPSQLYRGRPPRGTEFMDWLRSSVAKCGIRYVIIDDLTSLRRTGSGTTDTLKLMRELREFREEAGISILVIAESKATADGTAPSESDLGSQAALCTAADSVFAIGRVWRRPEMRYLMQTRSRNAPVVWTPQNSRLGTLERGVDGMLKFRFDPPYDAETRAKIIDIKIRREEGMTFREIAAELGVSKSHAQRLVTRWSPEMEREEEEHLGSLECGLRSTDCGVLEVNSSVGSSMTGAVGVPPFLTVSGDEEECSLSLSSAEAASTSPMEEAELSGGSRLGVPALAGSGGCETIRGDAGPSKDGTPNCEGRTPAGPVGAPFCYDGSVEAEAWFLKLAKENPDRKADDILDDYHKGAAWCRPPGAVPPYDPADPFKRMEIEYDDLGTPSFVEKRDGQGRKKEWYAYASDGRLRKWTRNGYGASGSEANPNLFGRAALIPREMVRGLGGAGVMGQRTGRILTPLLYPHF